MDPPGRVAGSRRTEAHTANSAGAVSTTGRPEARLAGRGWFFSSSHDLILGNSGIGTGGCRN